MKIMSFLVGAVLVGVGFFGVSTSVEAYEARAIALSPTHTLLVTTYSETLLNRDGVIPMAIKVGTEGTHDPLTASFNVKGNNNTNFLGQTHGGFILSSNPIMHGGYALTAGEKATLMLVVLISHEASAASDVRARLTSLPILTTNNGEIDSKTTKTY
ncbi:MAG: hypothetical protein ACK42D_03510 [Candidatus Paceibacteria bacterium]